MAHLSESLCVLVPALLVESEGRHRYLWEEPGNKHFSLCRSYNCYALSLPLRPGTDALQTNRHDCIQWSRIIKTGWSDVWLLVGASQYTKVAGLIPSLGTCKSQPRNAYMSGTTDRCLSLFLPLSLSLPSSLSSQFNNFLRKKKLVVSSIWPMHGL